MLLIPPRIVCIGVREPVSEEIVYDELFGIQPSVTSMIKLFVLNA